MSREQSFQAEMKLADTMRILLSDKCEYEPADVIKSYMTFLRKCYHGETFEAGSYRCGEILDLPIAKSMFDQFKITLTKYGLCKIDIEDVCCEVMLQQ